jgi:hypothetical protein
VDGVDGFVAGGDAAPVFDVEAAFDDVAAAVVDRIESGWSSAARSTAGAVAGLVGGFGISAMIRRERRCVRMAREK